VMSLSWLASDIAPVGQKVDGRLRTALVDADTWILAATSTRLVHCLTTSALQTSIRASNRRLIELALDESVQNLREVRPPAGAEARALLSSETKESVLAYPTGRVRSLNRIGGVFRSALLDALARSADVR